MARDYLKKATKTAQSGASDVRATVQGILDEIEIGGDAAALRFAEKFDQYKGPILLSAEDIAAAAALVPQKLKDDIAFSHDNVRRFAEAQKSTMSDVELEIVPGLIAGQRVRRPGRGRNNQQGKQGQPFHLNLLRFKRHKNGRCRYAVVLRVDRASPPINLETSVGRARVCGFRSAWQGALSGQ